MYDIKGVVVEVSKPILYKNDNGKMDTNFLGIPKEPVAISNNAKGKFGPPKYKDAKFMISTSPTNIKIKFN